MKTKLLALIILFAMVPVAVAQASSISIPTTINRFAASAHGWSTSSLNINQPYLRVYYSSISEATFTGRKGLDLILYLHS